MSEAFLRAIEIQKNFISDYVPRTSSKPRYTELIPEAVRLYESGMSTNELAEKLGVSDAWIKTNIIYLTDRGRSAGSVEYGYTWTKEGGLARKEDEHKIIDRIVELKAKGISLQEMSYIFMEEGVTWRDDAEFYPTRISRILFQHRYRSGQ
jgi:biotin operon repressor